MAYQSNAFYLFNCDKTYNLEIVETFLLEVGEKYGFEITVEHQYFDLRQMADLCETTLPQLLMDFAVFVLNADESRLSINEDNAGIGYASLYRALLQKTDDNVLIVIGGDKYYRDKDEKAQSVISRWARRKVASQFNEEYLDGRQSFIFSWNKKHRRIHEEAMRHFLDPGKRGSKFEYTPRPLPKPPQPLQKPEVPNVSQPAVSHPRQQDNEESSRTHDREAPTRKLRDDAARGNYGAIGPGASGTPATYPAGTVLLQAYMRYGRISFKDEDILKEVQGWRPTKKQESDLAEGCKSIPVAKVTFVSTDDGGVRYTVDVVKVKANRTTPTQRTPPRGSSPSTTCCSCSVS